MKRFISLMLIACLLIAGLGVYVAAAGGSNAVAEARNGVVRIFAFNLVYDEDGWLTGYEGGFGTGFGVGIAGEPTAIFATNKHVVEGFSQVYILLDDAWYDEWLEGITQGKLDADMEHAIKCDVIYMPDTYPDYAILRAERVITERVALPLMPADLVEPADTVYALGYPGISDLVTSDETASLESMSTTKGIVSRHTVFADEGNAEVIQTDADINKGNSGGPLITEEGYVVGLNTWYFSANNSKEKINLALEIDYVINRLNNLIDNGTLNNFSFTVIEDRYPNTVDPIVIAVIAIAVVVAAVAGVVMMRRGKSVSHQDREQKDEERRNEEQFPETTPVTDVIGRTVPAYDMAQYRLVCDAGQFAGRRFALDRPLRMGRIPEKNDLKFDEHTAGVSGVHCVIAPVAEGIALTDLGSTYGTILGDGKRIGRNETVILNEGDIFCLGSNNQIFRIECKEQ